MLDFYEELVINPRGQFHDGASNTIFFFKPYIELYSRPLGNNGRQILISMCKTKWSEKELG